MHRTLRRHLLCSLLLAGGTGCSSAPAGGSSTSSEGASSSGADVSRPSTEPDGDGSTPSEPTAASSSTDAADPSDGAPPSAESTGSPPPDPATDDTGAGANEDPQPSAGCGVADPPTGAGDRTVMVDGASRRFQLVVPPDIDPAQPKLLLVAFHGGGGTGGGARSMFGRDRAEAYFGAEAIYAYPSAPNENWDQTRDLPFFDALLQSVAEEQCIDLARVFVVGHSQGGGMASQVACKRGEDVRGVLVNDTGRQAQAPCEGRVASWANAVEQNDGRLDASRHNAGLFAESNGCADEPLPMEASPDWNSCEAYPECDDGYPVQLCLRDGLHRPPDFSLDQMWAFIDLLR